MTTSKRVQDRSKNKRVHDLEIVAEKYKIASKVLFLMEVLRKEPEMIAPMRMLDQYRRQINLPKPHSIVDFLRKSPELFELYKDQKGVLWCGMTEEAENLLKEEDKLIEDHMDKAAEFVTRMLMMSVDKRLRLDQIVHFRRDFGLPIDFRTTLVSKYPDHFRVVEFGDKVEHLELLSWNPAWAITELEKKTMEEIDPTSHTPGFLSLPFPLKFPSNFKKVYRHAEKIDYFQKLSYLSPYADARGLEAGSKEFDKRAVAVMHELLSFTLEKRLVTDHLTHFRREFVMPQKLMRLLLKHLGIFYVSERGKRFSVFLTEGYEGRDLIHKSPLVLWKEKVASFVGYRGKKKKIDTFSDLSDLEDEAVVPESDADVEKTNMQLDQEEKAISELDDFSSESDEMEIEEVDHAYKIHRVS